MHSGGTFGDKQELSKHSKLYQSHDKLAVTFSKDDLKHSFNQQSSGNREKEDYKIGF